jgi:hypothetical protein
MEVIPDASALNYSKGPTHACINNTADDTTMLLRQGLTGCGGAIHRRGLVGDDGGRRAAG